MTQPTGYTAALTTPQVTEAAKVPLSTLNYWVLRGLVKPSLIDSAGHRFVRYWSVRDLVLVRLIKSLRDAGCPLQQVIRAQETLDRIWATDLDRVVLYWDGHDILAKEWDEIASVVAEPGQEALLVIAQSVARWKVQAEDIAKELDLTDGYEHRRDYRTKHPIERTSTMRLNRPVDGDPTSDAVGDEDDDDH